MDIMEAHGRVLVDYSIVLYWKTKSRATNMLDYVTVHLFFRSKEHRHEGQEGHLHKRIVTWVGELQQTVMILQHSHSLIRRH